MALRKYHDWPNTTEAAMSEVFSAVQCFFLARLPRAVALALLIGGSPSWASESAAAVKPPEPMEFIVNIKKDGNHEGILRIAIVLEYADSRMAAHYLRFRPKLMHQILLVLSEQASEVLLSRKGKIELKQKIVKEINQTFRETEQSGVMDALITDFFVQ